MGALRRAAYPLRLAGARLASGGERLALIAIGIVAGAAVLAAVLAGKLVMQDRALAQATAKLAPADRQITVAWFGAVGDTWRQLDREVTAGLQDATGRKPVRAMLFREASIQGRLVNLRAADDLARWVHLSSGRLPRTCVPQHCEVLRIQGRGPIPSTPYLRLVEVGTATIPAGTPFRAFVEPATENANSMVARAVVYHTPQPSPVVLAEGVDGLSRTRELETFFRSYAWFVTIRKGDVHPWAIGDFRRTLARVSADIGAQSDQFQVTAPVDELAAAADSSKAAGRRLLLLGGEAAALLLAFTILAAVALRRDVGDARRRLVWSGARRWQVELFTFAEAAAVAVAATVAGWAAGAAIGAFAAAQAGSPAADVVEHALLSRGGLATGAAVAVCASLLLYAAVRAPAVQLGRLSLTPLDVAALGAIAVVVVGFARGSVDASALAAKGATGSFLLLVPALVTFAAAVLAARLLAPALRALGRVGRRGSVSLRLAALSLARNPGHAAVAATFLVASLGLALFAATYRSTLLRGQQDEAAYAVPAPYVLTEDFTQLVPVRHGWRGPATQILRLSGTVPSSASFTFLALPASTLAHVGGWRSDFAAAPPRELARRLQPASSAATRTVALPTGRTITIPVSTRGDDVALRAIFRSPLGDYDQVELGVTDGSRTKMLHARIPFRGARLAGIELDLLSPRRTANAGTGIQPSAIGRLRVGTPRVDGAPVRDAFAGWIGTGGVATPRGASIGYALTVDRTGIARPRQPTDGRPLPVLATPAVAAAAGADRILPLSVEGELVPARIVGVVRRFPSIVGDAVVADRQAAATTLDARSPGLGTTDELWLDRLPHDASELTVASRAETYAQLRDDPLARGALATLAGTALVALGLALVGLLLGVVGDRRDERGELFDLEAQGASPATIRTHLRLRALIVAAFGLVGGLITGAILSALVLSLVSLTASTAKPEPPLVLALDWRLLALAILAYAALAWVLITLATRLGGRAPERAAEAVG
jgi:hypothetical protein